MSDIFISLNSELNRPPEVNKFLKWSNANKIISENKNGIYWALSRSDDMDIWGPAIDIKSNVKVILNGRIALEEDEWKKAKNIKQITGGLACKYILNKWNEKNVDAINDLNGAFTIVIIDFNDHKINIWTDRLGIMPLYKDKENNFISSHPDLISKVYSLNNKKLIIDKVTIGEFIKTGSASFPHTYWQEVKQINSGMELSIDLKQDPKNINERSYFSIQNFSGPYITNRKKIVKLLANAIKSSIKKRTLSILGNSTVLLSAGADSRAILFSMNNASKAKSITLYDEDNSELQNAKKMANIASIHHTSIKRASDYYLKYADQSIKISGGMWSIDSAHYTGIIDTLQESDNILSGCYADYLLKGLAYNRKTYKLFGKNLPLYKFTKFDDQFYQPHFKINKYYDQQILSRTNNLYKKLKNFKGNISAGYEYLRSIPLSREADASGRLILRRTCGFDTFMADNEIIDLITRIHPSEKLNGIAFSQAVASIQPKKAHKILNNNFSAPLKASELMRILHFIKNSLKRKILSSLYSSNNSKNRIATPGSWPNMAAVIGSSKISYEWLEKLPDDHSKIIFDILNNGESSWTINEWQNHPFLFLRVFTISRWIEIQDR